MIQVQLELVSMGKLSSEIQRLAMQQREFLIKVLESCVTLKTHVETDLQNGWSHFPELTDAREMLGKAKASLQMIDSPNDVCSLHSQLINEKQRLQAKYQEMMLQCQLDDLIGNSGVVFDFALLKQALAGIHSGEALVTQTMGNGGRMANHLAAAQNPILFLANYCMSQLYSRHIVSKQQHMQNGSSIEYHANMLGPPTPTGSMHLHQGAPPQQNQQLLIQPGSPSLKVAPPTPTNSMIHSQQQGTFLPDTGSSGALVTVHSPQQAQSNNLGLRGPSNSFPMYYFNIEVSLNHQESLFKERMYNVPCFLLGQWITSRANCDRSET